jgi:hypothetical protein
MSAGDSFNGEHEQQSQEDFRKMMDAFLQNRAVMIQQLKDFADELNEVHKNVKITKVVTGSTGIAGTILCITGLALAIPTAGLSIFLTIGGGTLAALSGTAHLGSDIAEKLITKARLDKFNELCQADEANVLKLNDHLERENEKLQNTFNEHTSLGTALSAYGEVTTIGNLTCSIVRISQAATLTVNTIKMVGIATAALSKE